MKTIFLILLSFLFAHLSHSQQVATLNTTTNQWIVAMSTVDATAHFQHFFPAFNGTTFEIKAFDSTFYLHSNGYIVSDDGDTNAIAYRINLTFGITNNILILESSTNLVGESCTGNPCSHCKFKKEGGCECESNWLSGVCNHTVTK
jgi:hypothetical protein